MSFKGLKDEVFVVLQIKEGHGFGFATSPLIVTANLGGNVHESFLIQPCPQPKFEIVFVWTMDKTMLKNFWSEKVPVRIECLSVNGAQRTRIGYIILNLKDVQITQLESKINEKQTRLLGLTKEASMTKPELIFSLYLTDIPIQRPTLTPQFSPRLTEQPLHMADKPLKITLGTPKDVFVITIKPVAVNNLKELLPSQSDVEPELVKYTYHLLGAEVVSDWSTGHSVQLAVASSLAGLKTYLLHNYEASVNLHMGDLLIGQTTISLENLLLWDDIGLRKGKQFSRTMSSHCEVTSTGSVLNSGTTIDFTITIRKEHTTSKKTTVVPPPLPLNCLAAGGDGTSVMITALESPPSLPLVRQSQISDSQLPSSGRETYRAQQPSCPYTVSVIVTSLQLHKPLPHYWLRLSHTSGTVCPPYPAAIVGSWSPLQWKLSLTLPRHLLEPTLASQPPTLHLGLAEQELAHVRLKPPDTISTLISGEQRLELEREGESVGEVGVVWTKSDINSKPSTAVTDFSIHQTQSKIGAVEFISPREREMKILSFVEELEDWADKQRTIIMHGLEEEKAARLAELQSRWEEEVGGQVTEGRQLVEALQNVRDQLNKQQAELQDNQNKLKVYKEDLERIHRNKLLEFKDLSRMMQDEFNRKLAIIAKDKVAVEREVDELRLQNAEMRQALREAESKIEEDRKLIANLTHEQYVLKEKLSMEQESKSFFKDHCRKAEQEIHRLNCLRQEELEVRLSSEKKSLEQLAIQQLIVERNDHRQDQRVLEEIRQQLQFPFLTEVSDSNEMTRSDRPSQEERHIRRAP